MPVTSSASPEDSHIMLLKQSLVWGLLSSLVSLSLASPMPSTVDGNLVGIEAPSDMVKRVFGTDSFDEFLGMEMTKRAEAPAHLFKRATSPVLQTDCNQNQPFIADAQQAINQLRGIPAGTQCGNNRPGKCVCMQKANNVCVGICGPTNFNMACSRMVPYFQGILDSCKRPCQYCIGNCWTEYKIKGYQGLNENIANYVFIDYYNG